VQGISLTEREEIRQYLASTEFFRDLDEVTFSSVEAELEWVEIDTGDVLMRQGEVGDCLFVLLSGRLRAFIQRDNGTEVPVGEISPGEAVGEMSIITDERRSATVRSLRPSTLVRLTRTGFNRLQARHTEIMRLMAELVVRRLRQVNLAAKSRTGKLTLGIVGGGMATGSFVSRLVKALSRIDSTCHVSAAVVDAQVGPGFAESRSDTAQNFRLTNWLSEQERRHRFVVYEACETNPDSQWTRRVLEHADRVLLAVPADEQPLPSVAARFALESREFRSAARRDLILVHEGTRRPVTGTTRWMEAVPSEDRYHIFLDCSEDFERLARIIAGQAIGLVLGGGGARGFAHIGIIRALREANIPIDYVGGTSIGAVIAAQCALDWDAATMLERNRKYFRMHPIHGDYGAEAATGTPHKASRLFESLFGESLIEDQWRNFFSVACNLTRGEIVVGRKGRFRDRVEASNALPVLNSPFFEKGDAIVDGAVINNLPADVMQRCCGGRVIAVDVSPRSDLGASTNEFRRLVRSGQQPVGNLPSVHSVVMRTVMLNSLISAESMRRYADVYMNPPVEDIEMFDWAAIQDAEDIGYRYASRELQTIRHLFPSEK
jgi:predicted acylesterase/phospholipase RssA/CRP-like cAMP-binding protein